jgi:Stigma-specific protein, Stig1
VSQQTTTHSFDELARALASGTLSRGKALRLMGGLLVGSALGFLPGVAWADDDDDDRCPQGQTRCGERCVNLRFNERHCGSCRNRCRSNQTCCNGRCVNLQRNERHCGRCFNRCDEGEQCVEGRCGGGDPICTPPCSPPCTCVERADGTGTACVDCSSTGCQDVSSCDACTAAGRICFGPGPTFGCGNPCQSCIPPSAILCDFGDANSCAGGLAGGCTCVPEASGGGLAFCSSGSTATPCSTSCDCPAGQFCQPSGAEGLCVVAAEMCPRV